MNLAKVKEKKTRTLNYRQPLTKKQSLHMDVILLLSRSVPSLRLTIIFYQTHLFHHNNPIQTPLLYNNRDTNNCNPTLPSSISSNHTSLFLVQ